MAIRRQTSCVRTGWRAPTVPCACRSSGYYQQQGRWTDALAASDRARQQFPADFNLALLHARSLVHLERASDALTVLEKVRVLPSENAHDSHQMYVQAHVLAALAAYDRSRWDEANGHLRSALEWPEHLGQGKPYDPEERLIRFLQGRVAERRGSTVEARRHFEAVVASTGSGTSTPVDLLAAAARQSPGQADTAFAVPEELRKSRDLDDVLLVRAMSLARR